MPRNFLTGAELSAAELGRLIERAAQLKAAPLSSQSLRGRSIALIFQKPSTRTRLSFEAGVHELGGTRCCCAPRSYSSPAGSRCATPP